MGPTHSSHLQAFSYHLFWAQIAQGRLNDSQKEGTQFQLLTTWWSLFLPPLPLVLVPKCTYLRCQHMLFLNVWFNWKIWPAFHMLVKFIWIIIVCSHTLWSIYDVHVVCSEINFKIYQQGYSGLNFVPLLNGSSRLFFIESLYRRHHIDVMQKIHWPTDFKLYLFLV